MTTRVDSSIIAAVLDRLHATAGTKDRPVMERAILASESLAVDDGIESSRSHRQP